MAISQQDGATLIAFRGTANLEQWAEDADCIPVHLPLWPGFVHEGFARAIERALPVVMSLLPPRNGDHPPVIHLGGHSLGAGLASLFAWFISESPGYRVGNIHLFGAPRVGDYIFAGIAQRVLGHLVTRWVNHNDVVPHLPLFPFTHIGELQYFDAAGQAQSRMTDCRLLELNWDDHHIGNYVRLLTAAAKTQDSGHRLEIRT